MPRANPAARRRKLEEKQARIKAELQRAAARQRERERKRAARRQFLTGRMALDQVERGEVSETVFKAHMDRFLTSDRDRALFDLPPPAFQRVRDLRAEGKSLRLIAEILEARGRPPLPPESVPPCGHAGYLCSVWQLLRQLEAADISPAATEEVRHGSAE